MNVIDYITITCNQKKVWLQITVPISKLMCQFPVPMITNCQNITINYNFFPRKWLSFIVLEVQMSCQMQYQNHDQSLNVMFVKRHENIGIFYSIFSNRAIRKSQPAKIQNTTWWAETVFNDLLPDNDGVDDFLKSLDIPAQETCSND
jgi:hypothetical protein